MEFFFCCCVEINFLRSKGFEIEQEKKRNMSLVANLRGYDQSETAIGKYVDN